MGHIDKSRLTQENKIKVAFFAITIASKNIKHGILASTLEQAAQSVPACYQTKVRYSTITEFFNNSDTPDKHTDLLALIHLSLQNTIIRENNNGREVELGVLPRPNSI